MKIKQCCILVTNHTNLNLEFRDVRKRDDSRITLIATLALAIVAWPLYFLVGITLLSTHSSLYLKTRIKQVKLVRILKNHTLDDFANKRLKSFERRSTNLTIKASRLMERNLKNPHELGFLIPPKKGFNFSYLSLNKDWKNFKWIHFLTTDFFEKSNNPHSPDKTTLHRLERIRLKLNRITNQKEYLLHVHPSQKPEAIEKIAQLSFIKNRFRRESAKEWMIRSFFWLLPGGVFLDVYFNSTNNSRITYQGKKELLPNQTSLNGYLDLIDAHNQLVTNNRFLVPYIKQTLT